MTTFVDVIHTETGVHGEVPEASLAVWLARGYELAPDDGEGGSAQPFPYVRRLGDLSGNVELDELASMLELTDDIAYAPTLGDLMRPCLPSRAPLTKMTADASAVSSWDTLGTSYAAADIADVIDLNGTPIVSGFGVQVDPSGQGSAKVLDVETIMTGTDLFLDYYAVYADQPVRVWCDDEELDVNPVVCPGTGVVTLRVQAAVYGTYAIRVAGQFFLNAVKTNHGTTLQKPPRRLTMAVVSDSYYEAFPAFNVVDSTPVQLRTATGFKILNMAEGGTGFVNPGSGGLFSPFGSASRLDALEAADWDFLLTNGSVNDQYYTAAAMGAAMSTYFDNVAERKPGKPIYVVGLERLNNAPLVTWQGHLDAQLAAVEGAPNVVGYIDPFTESWLTGTGDDITPTGDGNQDFTISGVDEVHPNRFGARMWAFLTALRLRPLRARL